MLLLTGTTDAVKIVTGSALNTDVHASWVDNAAGVITPGRTNTPITTAATTTVVPAPAPSTQRNVQTLNVRNKDATNPQTVTVQHTDGTTTVELLKVTLPAGYTLSYLDSVGWMVTNANGQALGQGTIGGTPAVVLGNTAAAGVASTFLRTDDTIDAFDGSTPVNIAAAAVVGVAAAAAHSDHTHTIGAGVVSRTMLDATGKNWQFLGQATANAAVRTGTVTWTGTYKQLMFEYFIAGYSGAAVGRLIVGPTAGLSETGTTFCTNLIEGVTQNTTSVSVPGWPTAVTAGAVARWGWMQVQNIAASIKHMIGRGHHSGTAPTVVPISMIMDGLFNDVVNLINKAELAVYALITGATISTTTFNNGTYVNVWGRNDD